MKHLREGECWAGLWIWDLSCVQPSPQHEVAHTGPKIHTHTEHRSSLQNQSHTLFIYKVKGLKLCFPLLPSLDFIYKSSIHVYFPRTNIGGGFLQSQILPLKGYLRFFLLYIIIPTVNFKICFHLPQMSLLMLWWWEEWRSLLSFQAIQLPYSCGNYLLSSPHDIWKDSFQRKDEDWDLRYIWQMSVHFMREK